MSTSTRRASKRSGQLSNSSRIRSSKSAVKLPARKKQVISKHLGSTDIVDVEEDVDDKQIELFDNDDELRKAFNRNSTFGTDIKAKPKRKSYRMNPLPIGRPIRVYADGIFDLYHFGHARMLEQCKNVFPGHDVHLIVGVCDDKLTHAMKGKTVMTDIERYESVRHCKHVDEVVESAPWVLTPDFLKTHFIDYVAHDDDPYPDASGEAGGNDVYAFVREAGMFVATQRTKGISTSDIITRIVKDYDKFVRRNLARGYSRKDMNVSFLKEKRLAVAESVGRLQGQVEAQVDEMKNNVRDNVTEISDNLLEWMHNSSRLVEDFMSLFGRDGQIKRIIKSQSQRFSELAKKSPM